MDSATHRVESSKAVIGMQSPHIRITISFEPSIPSIAPDGSNRIRDTLIRCIGYLPTDHDSDE